MSEENTKIPIVLTLHAEYGFDITDLTEIEKKEHKLSFCASLNDSLFRIIKHAMQYGGEQDLSDDLINLTNVGIGVSRYLMDEIEQLDTKYKSKRDHNRKKKNDSHETNVNLVSEGEN